MVILSTFGYFFLVYLLSLIIMNVNSLVREWNYSSPMAMIRNPPRIKSLPRRVIRSKGVTTCVWFVHFAGFILTLFVHFIFFSLSHAYIHTHKTSYHELIHDLLTTILHHYISKVITVTTCIHDNPFSFAEPITSIVRACITPFIILTRILMQKHSSSKAP